MIRGTQRRRLETNDELPRYARRSTRRTVLGLIRTYLNLYRNHHKKERKLEIGPGQNRLDGFETLNVLDGADVDYVFDVSKPLPFDDSSFDLVYASHVIEHIPWFKTDETLAELFRILKPAGVIEIWIPDGLKIAKALVDFETKAENYIAKDGWYRFNAEKDPCKWAAGRIFTYGDGTGNPVSPNWHLALFTPRYLKMCLQKAGFTSLREMERSDVRGVDHGWINLGVCGIKPID